MISREDQKILVDAIALLEQNPNASQMDKGYGAAMRIMLMMLTTRSNSQSYAIGRDSLINFKNRQLRAAPRY